MKNFRELQLTQMESRLRKWRQAKLPSRPTAGWVKSIRESLGMSASALGRRLGMSHSAINKFELAEANDAITLGSLKKIAAALDCELQYALIPRKTLNDQLQEQALKVAHEQLIHLSHSMDLEAQGLQASAGKRQLELLAKELREGSGRELWK